LADGGFADPQKVVASVPEQVGVSDAPAAGAPVSLDPAFDRDQFLLRKKMLTGRGKYDVCDEQGQSIVFVQRRGSNKRNLGVAVGFTAVLILLGWCWLSIKFLIPPIMVSAGVLGLPIFAVVAVASCDWLHLQFFRADSKSEPLLEILQDKKFTVSYSRYTVNDPNGRTLAQFSTNLFKDLFRRRWICCDPSGQVMCVALLDSPLRALIRAWMTKIPSMNYLILNGQTGAVIGLFNREPTLLDRCVLDLSQDPQRTLDRRVALALGVILADSDRR
jgi:hypothetical protein